MNSMIEYLNNNGIPPFPSGSSFNSLFIRNLINYLKERKIDNLVIKSKNNLPNLFQFNHLEPRNCKL